MGIAKIVNEQWRDMRQRVWKASPCKIENQPRWSYEPLFLFTRGSQFWATKGDLTIPVTAEQLCRLAAMATDRSSFSPEEF